MRYRPSRRRRYSSVPWAQIVAFRNLVVHEYFRVSLAPSLGDRTE